MKNKFALLCTLSVILLLSPACDDNDSDCTYVKLITVPSGCYDPKVGLTLTASGNEEEAKNYEWELYILKEKTDGITPSDAKQVHHGLVVTLNDNVLLDNEQVWARVTTYCEAQYLYSMYFKFLKETSASCTTWAPAE